MSSLLLRSIAFTDRALPVPNFAYCDLKAADLKASGTENLRVPNQQITSPQLRQRGRALLAANTLRLRSEKGWSQEALAHECGLHRTFVAHVERQARNISLDNIERIATALGVAVHVLLSPFDG